MSEANDIFWIVIMCCVIFCWKFMSIGAQYEANIFTLFDGSLNYRHIFQRIDWIASCWCCSILFIAWVQWWLCDSTCYTQEGIDRIFIERIHFRDVAGARVFYLLFLCADADCYIIIMNKIKSLRWEEMITVLQAADDPTWHDTCHHLFFANEINDQQ